MRDDGMPIAGLPLGEAARRLGISPKALRKRIEQGKGVTGYRAGGLWYVDGPPSLLAGLSAPARAQGDAGVQPEPMPLASAPAATTDDVATQSGDSPELAALEARLASQVEIGVRQEEAARELIDALKEEVAFLRRELEARGEEIRRRDHIIAGLTSRLPALPAATGAATEAPAPAPEMATEPAAIAGLPPRTWRFWRRR